MEESRLDEVTDTVNCESLSKYSSPPVMETCTSSLPVVRPESAVTGAENNIANDVVSIRAVNSRVRRRTSREGASMICQTLNST